MAGIFHNYFAHVGNNLATKIPLVNTPVLPPLCGNHLILCLTTMEIMEMFTNLKDGAAGQDGIPAWVIKAIGQNVSLPLSHLVNLSFTSGTFPHLSKRAI